MVKEQGNVAASSMTLRVLLLICAGALIIMVVTIALDVQDAYMHQIVNDVPHDTEFCGMSSREFMALPDALKSELRVQCTLDATVENH
jgi:hypothetical protein